MKGREHFPLGTAEGSAFCNRTVETEWLLGNIQSGKHSLIVAPRRYGKSSLAMRAIERSKLSTYEINFNICADERDVENEIRKAVSDLINSVVNSAEKLLNAVKNYIGSMKPSIVIDAGVARLELTRGNRSNPASVIEEILLIADKLLQDKKKTAILLFDEFQAVGEISKGKGIEAAIRNAAQKMKKMNIIFSGSNRHLLQIMFGEEGRPLYRLCRKLYLERISREHYRGHLNEAAIMQWGAILADSAFDSIMLLTEQHPYYVNYLCDTIWGDSKINPKKTDVDAAWCKVLEEESSDANKDLSTYSSAQKKILRYMAKHSGKKLLSGDVAKYLGVVQSTISSALIVLEEKDVIEKSDDGYIIINPILKYILRGDRG